MIYILFSILLFNILGNGQYTAACFIRRCKFMFLSQMILQMQRRDRVFFLVLKIRLFSNNLDANKILVFFPLKASSNLLSEKPILSCSVVRCQTSLYFDFLLIKLKVNLVKELRHSLLHLFLHKVFPNVYLFIQLTFLTSVQQKLQFSCME